jgi:glucose/arabinose dehydrogenase
VSAAQTVTAAPSRPVNASEFPDAAAYAWTPVASGVTSPVDIQFPKDGTDRMFIVEQPGRIRVVEQGQVLARPFLDMTDRVDSQGNEQGLLGLAFDPRYGENGQFFVDYTDKHKQDVIARYHVSSDPNAADPTSETILVSVDDPFTNHNGGVLAFGPDGYLYAGLGDGGGAGDPLGNGQNVNSLLGSILRLDVENGEPYAIPANNPFAQGGGKPEIWAYGLRNPWRLSFDRTMGDLYIGDVGQDSWEEVDFLPAASPGGTNFGWNFREGNHAFAGSPPATLHLTYPVAEYSHREGGCSITGGYVYRGQLQAWQGIYFYGDYCSGKIWGLRNAAASDKPAEWSSRLLFQTGSSITTFGQDTAGELYFADRSGTIYRLGQAP